MSLALPVWVLVDETVDTSGTESGSGNALTFLASPWTGSFATTEGFDGSGDDCGFSGLLPFR